MGRPRSEAANRAVVEATAALLLEVGIEGTTIEEVAARSGVAKSTIYRHFGSREDLLVAAGRGCIAEQPTPDTGSFATDLRALFDRWSSEGERRVTDLLPLLLDAASRDPRMDEVVEAVLEERRRPLRTIIQLAQHRGEIDPGMELGTAMAIVVGPFTYRRVVERREATPEFVQAVTDAAIAALRATATSGVVTSGVRPRM
ncbi:MAG: TetR/AcrR family transcriptional regulator [Acidimicrobiales bacterium]|nr:TetR/AcrR family transcriptional regulator [Acidimicrobiales bacterium]